MSTTTPTYEGAPLPIGTHGKVTIRTLPDGRVLATARFRDDSGITRRVRASAVTPDEAQRNLEARIATRMAQWQGTMLPTDTMATAVGAYLDEIATLLRPATVLSYEQGARLHVIPRLGKLRLFEVTPSRIAAALRDITGRSGPGAAGIPVVVIRASLDLAVRRGAIEHNPARAGAHGGIPRPPRGRRWVSEPPVVAAELIVQVRAALRGDPASVMVADTFDLIAGTGLESSELLGLQYGDADGRTLTVSRNIVRVKGLLIQAIPPRTYALPWFGAEVIARRERQSTGPFVFGDHRPVDPKAFQSRWVAAMGRTGIVQARTVTRRVLRSLAGNDPAAALGLDPVLAYRALTMGDRP